MGVEYDAGQATATSAAGTSFGTKEFWRREHPKFVEPHHRLEKAARLINRMAGSEAIDLLDVGCGPATLGGLLSSGIRYYGIDLSIADPAPNLRELDILQAPIGFGDRRFDIVVSQGVFEYLGEHQAEKFAEIATLLTPRGRFLVSYTNFSHRRPNIYEAFTNVQSIDDFRTSLEQVFTIQRVVPSVYNWEHGQPRRGWLRWVNMRLNADVPWLGRHLAVEYFFVCAPFTAGG